MKTLLTRSYIKTMEREEIRVGNKYYFGELVEGAENLEKIIGDGSIVIDEVYLVEFVVTDLDTNNLLDSLLVVKGIY